MAHPRFIQRSDNLFECTYEPMPKQKLLHATTAKQILFGGAMGGPHPYNTKILTNFGWKQFSDIRIGDLVIDPTTGGNCRVIDIIQKGIRDCYKITFDDGASTECADTHLWSYRITGKHLPRSKKSKQKQFAEENLGVSYPSNRWDKNKIGTTLEIKEYLDQGCHPRIPLTEPVRFAVNGRSGSGKKTPYLLGLLLGDGTLGGLVIDCYDEEIQNYLINLGCSKHERKRCGLVGDLRKEVDTWCRNHNLKEKHWYAKSHEKFIPEYVFTANIEYRLEFLQGLMDTDGTVDDRGRCYFSTTSIKLAKGVQALVRSLGGKSRISDPKYNTYAYKNEKRTGRASFNVRCWLPKTSALFKLSRKKAKCTDSWNGGYELTRQITSIEYIGKKEVQCITVNSPYGLYLVDDYIVTHNSKSTALRWDAYIFAISNPHVNCFLFRRTRDDLLKNHIQFISREIPPSLGIYRKQDHYLEFINGSRVYMCYCDSDDDLKNFLGQEFHWLGIDEATTLEPMWLTQLFGRVRMSESERRNMKDAKRLPRVVYATNPMGGGGHAWLKEKFIDQSNPLTIFKDKFTVLDEYYDDEGNLHEKFDGWDSIYIPSKMYDNVHLPKNYAAQFNKYPPELRRAYVEGDWDAIIGAALHTLSKEKHMLPQFKMLDKDVRDPANTSHLLHFMAVDFGTASPSSVGWYCVTDKEYHIIDKKTGREIFVPPDSVIRYAEWYTAEDEYADRGMRLPADALARGIAQREQDWGLPAQDYRVLDYASWTDQGGSQSVHQAMARILGPFRQSIKSRPASYNEILSRLAGNPLYATDGEIKRPALYITSNCKMWWKLVPGLVLDPIRPDDGPEKKKQPVHLYDETVYALMSRPYRITEQERNEAEADRYRENYLRARQEFDAYSMGTEVDPYYAG